MSKLGIGVLGFGFIGNIHAKAAVNCPDTELVGVWTLPDHTRENYKALYPDKRSYDSPEEMAADPDIHAVAIGTPNSLHFPQGKLMLDAGKHVLVEKPMAMDLDEAKALSDVAVDSELRLMVGHMWRFDREVLAVKKLLDEDSLGEIVKTKGYGIHENWGPSGWFTDKALAGGGALVDMGVHAIDAVRFLLSDPQPLSVYATISTQYGNYDVDDTGILIIQWDNGTTSIIESGWWHPHMDGPEASTQLFGKKGYARVYPTMAKFSEDREPWIPRFPARIEHCDQHMYDGQMQEFANAIADQREPVPGATEGLVVMRICEAAYLSAVRGDVVKL